MKRSKSMVLTTLMASGGLSLAACDVGQPPAPNGGWLNPPAASSPAATSSAEDVGGRSYANLQACKDADLVPNGECETAFSDAQAQAPKFADQQSCEQRYGVDQCVPRNEAGGGSVFTPLLTGFIVGQALGNLGGNRGYYGNTGGGFGNDDGFRGRGRGQDYVSGRGNDGYSAPARVQSRSAVISRGGFGGGGGRFGG